VHKGIIASPSFLLLLLVPHVSGMGAYQALTGEGSCGKADATLVKAPLADREVKAEFDRAVETGRDRICLGHCA